MRPRGIGRRAKGSYVLLIGLAEAQTIAVGKLKPHRFRCGHYAYVGSALGGLRSRLDRHLRTTKKAHWHIDYLLEKARIHEIVTCETVERRECTIARALAERFDSIPGFGASDCPCRSHLFFDPADMTQRVMLAVETLGLSPRRQRPQTGPR